MATLAELEQAYNSLQTIFRTQIVPEFDRLKQEVANGATLEQVQARIDQLRAEFDNAYPRLESFLAQAQSIQPRPNDFIARLENSLNVNRPTNYQALGKLTQDAGQNTNKANADTAAKAAADQGSGVDSAADAAQTATVQNPPVTPTGNTTPTTADASVTEPPDPGVPPPVITNAGAAQGVSTGSSGTTSTQNPAASSGVNALQGSAVNTTTSSYIFKAVQVVSRFSRGQFTQELEGVLMQFPSDVTGNTAATSAQVAGTTGSSVASITGSTASQADARRADNAIDASQRTTPDQSAAESARLAVAGRTPDQSSAESARLLAQAGRAAQSVAGIPAGSLDTVSTALTAARGGDAAATVGSLARLTGTSPAGASLVQAGVSLLPAQVSPATSLGVTVGVGTGTGRGTGSGASRPQTTAITIPTREGGEVTVSTAQQVQALANQGIISNATRDSALAQLASLQAVQQPQTTVDRQAVTKDN